MEGRAGKVRQLSLNKCHKIINSQCGDYQECMQLLEQLGLADLYLLPRETADPQDEDIFGLSAPLPEEEKPSSNESTFDPERLKLLSKMLDDMREEYKRNFLHD